MKKIIFLSLSFLILFGLTGCADTNAQVKQSDLTGYWLQTEENWGGDITDLTNNPYAYLEITDTRMFFYTISFDEDEGYGVADKYYKLEDNKIYYDYYALKGNDWKENISDYYGGIFNVSFDGNKLILNEYSNGKDTLDGYQKNTYIKVDSKDWPIEE